VTVRLLKIFSRPDLISVVIMKLLAFIDLANLTNPWRSSFGF
jgi:hypothetical protein